MPQPASRGRSALKTLGFPGGKGRVLGIKDQAPRPEVQPLKATLLERVSPEERKLRYRKFEICVLYFKTKEKEKDTCMWCYLPLPPAQPLGTVITFSADCPLLAESTVA